MMGVPPDMVDRRGEWPLPLAEGRKRDWVLLQLVFTKFARGSAEMIVRIPNFVIDDMTFMHSTSSCKRFRLQQRALCFHI